MRIHSSSLTLTPANFNRPLVGQQNGAQIKNEKKEPLLTTDTHNNNPAYTSEELSQPLNNTGLTVSVLDNENAAPPRNTRISKALAAYSQELNKPLIDHQARVVERIDIYA